MVQRLFFPTLLCLLIASSLLPAQSRTYLGVNVSPLILNTLEVRADVEVSPGFALQSSLGVRFQRRPDEQPAFLDALTPFSNRHNYGAFLAVGGRFINPADNRYDFPFVAIDLIGFYADDEYLLADQGSGSPPEAVRDQRLSLGAMVTMGFVVYVTKRWRADLGLQMGYTPPPPDRVEYFYPGLGFSTYGRGIIGLRGGHIQPLISLKYNLIQDKRQRIHSMD
ncbi:MAG: hypothetical protein D6722_18415 [Bacteroidetes bacterium]|nr:MAG: hypothetical protein D6722_18415 [Bacteroidota bacterium]